MLQKSLSGDTQTGVIEAFNSVSRYLDDLLNIDNHPYFEGKVSQIYPAESPLNKADTSDTKAPFLDLNLSVLDGFVSSKNYDKRDDFDLDIVNFPFLDGDIPRTLLIVFTSRNLFALLGCPVIWLISMPVTKV